MSFLNKNCYHFRFSFVWKKYLLKISSTLQILLLHLFNNLLCLCIHTWVRVPFKSMSNFDVSWVQVLISIKEYCQFRCALGSSPIAGCYQYGVSWLRFHNLCTCPGVHVRHAHPREARGARVPLHGAGERHRAARRPLPHTRVRARPRAGAAAHTRSLLLVTAATVELIDLIVGIDLNRLFESIFLVCIDNLFYIAGCYVFF